MLRTSLMIVAISLLFCSNANAQSGSRLEKRLIEVSRVATWATLPIWVKSPTSQVVGSGFLINRQGYFVTARHILIDNRQKQLQIEIRSAHWNTGGDFLSFDVIQEGTGRDHDIALCRIRGFRALEKERWHRGLPKWDFQYATLALGSHRVQTGELAIISGYPLAAENPSVQFGNIAATGTSNFSGNHGLIDRDIFQISVSGNQGDSGGPVISLRNGRVIGVVILESTQQRIRTQRYTIQGSGLEYAAPSIWIQKLLEEHHILSQYTAPKTLF